MKNKGIFDCAIIGAGVIGVSVFNKLTRLGKKCLLLDKASDVATGASKANSGLVHAGYDPEPGTLKAKMNVRGNFLFPRICKRLGIKLNKCGAMVVGDDEEKIKTLYDRGVKNKVDVKILSRQEIFEKVPALNKHITTALFAQNAYVVSPYLFTIALVDEAILNGGEVALEEDVVAIDKTELFEITTKKSKFFAKTLVNSTGAGFNEISKLVGGEEYPIELRRGEYFVFDKGIDLGAPCTIFPLPTKLGKGVLVTPTVDGNFLVGPTSEVGELSTKTTAQGLKDIKEKSKLLFENINFKNAIRQFSGIRVICGDDFIIEKSKKVEGLINLAGICSPGLSSAPAIAEEVARLLGVKNKEVANLKKIEPYFVFKDLPKAKQIQLSKENKDYCEIVCKCENITKGDVVLALHRPLKIRSVDGVKRRTNAGMGRCQGGFCFTKVINEICKQNKIKYCEVLKENRGSNVALGNIREVQND
ncbi:MAG: FAD-dependent oxidoreductase [Clostridia bacterium]|nr:FAD-dependent oxidoreductase [Clostridia bacterium]